VSMRRERNTTLNYATARSVAESFCSGGPNADISDSSAVASDEKEKRSGYDVVAEPGGARTTVACQQSPTGSASHGPRESARLTRERS
jgi:hypothetical protein